MVFLREFSEVIRRLGGSSEPTNEVLHILLRWDASTFEREIEQLREDQVPFSERAVDLCLASFDSFVVAERIFKEVVQPESTAKSLTAAKILENAKALLGDANRVAVIYKLKGLAEKIPADNAAAAARHKLLLDRL